MKTFKIVLPSHYVACFKFNEFITQFFLDTVVTVHCVWEIKNSNFLQIFSRYGRKCKQIAFIPSNFVIHPQILTFSLFNVASFFPYWLQIKIFISLFFYVFTSAINLWTRNSSQQTSLQCLSTINMVFSNDDKILIKHIITLSIGLHSYMRRGIKIGANKMLFVCIFFHICWISAA